MKKSISDLIEEALVQKGERSIRIDDTNFFLNLIGRTNRKGRSEHAWKRVIWFGVFAAGFFGMLIFMVHSATFLIKDILLFDEKPIVTDAGAIIPQRSCNREQVLFYFNAADLWARTGVQLQRGDRIKISRSGGFHSDVVDIYLHAHDNRKLKYHYYGAGAHSTKGTEKCIYNKPNKADLTCWQRLRRDNLRDPLFGSILWQVNDENSILKNRWHDVHQIADADATDFIDIRENGELFLAVNDIVLTDSIIESFNAGKRAIWETAPAIHNLSKKDTIATGSLRNDPLWAREHDLDYIGIRGEGRDRLLYDKVEIRAYVRACPEMQKVWFQDNIGSVMICVEIERFTPWWRWMNRWYRGTERRIAWACDNRSIGGMAYRVVLAGGWSVVRLFWLPSAVALAILFFLYAKRDKWVLAKCNVLKRKKAVRETISFWSFIPQTFRYKYIRGKRLFHRKWQQTKAWIDRLLPTPDNEDPE